MNKIKLSLIFGLVTVGAMAQDFPPIQTSFSSPQECSLFYFNYSNNQNLPFDAYAFFYLFSNSRAGGFNQYTNCSNGVCTYNFYYHTNGSTNIPAAGGCALVGTQFWPQAVKAVQQEYNALINNGNLNDGTYYGVHCSNTTGQTPPADFNVPWCQLLSRSS
jgi:hypothetical protein